MNTIQLAKHIHQTSIWHNARGKNEQTYLQYMDTIYPGISEEINLMLQDGTFSKQTLVNNLGHHVTAYYRAHESNRGTVILLHGYDGCALQMVPYAQLYMQLGYNVLLPNWENHADSEGDQITLGHQEQRDLRLWMDEALRLFPGKGPLILHGVSMGAATAMLCSCDQRVSAVVEDCGYSDIMGQLRFECTNKNVTKAVPFWMNLANRRKLGWWLHRIRPIMQVRRSKVPMLFIHGENDKKVPHYMLQRLYDAHRRGPRTLWSVPGAGHTRSLSTDPEGYRQHITDFLASLA